MQYRVQAVAQLHDGPAGSEVDVGVVVELDHGGGLCLVGDGVDGRLGGATRVDPTRHHDEQHRFGQLGLGSQPAGGVVTHMIEGTPGTMTAMAIDVTDATFQDEVMEKSMTTPVVVDLWATWCGPCQTLTPILERGGR